MYVEPTASSVITQAYLYKWTHLPSGKWYIGSRTSKGCHPSDGYICSSKIVKPMIVENKNEWVRELLVIGEQLYIRELETKILNILDAAKDPMSFNQVNADGKFHRTGKTHTDDTKNKLKEYFTGKNHTQETKEHFSRTRQGKNNSFFGKHHSIETKQNLSDLNLGKKQTDEQIEAKTKRQTGVPRTDKAKKAISTGILSIKKISCDHCGKENSPALHTRWHDKNCKSRKKNVL